MNGTTLNDLWWPFKVTVIQRQITCKWYNIQLYLQRPTNRKSCLSNGAIFNDLKRPLPPVWRSRHSLTLNISETVRDTDIVSLIGTYTRPTQQCHFEWPWLILSDLAKYSMTRSVARSLCDSWASCLLKEAVKRLYEEIGTYCKTKVES